MNLRPTSLKARRKIAMWKIPFFLKDEVQSFNDSYLSKLQVFNSPEFRKKRVIYS